MSDENLYNKRRLQYAQGCTTDRHRIDIDSGKTGDKIPVVDPAAAPLGTDEEAGGTPIDPRIVDAVRRDELHRGVRTRSRKFPKPPKPPM